MSAENEPHLREQHATDKYGTKFVDKTGQLQEKAQNLAGKGDEEEKKQPAGGFDDTSLPHVAPGYTIRITFHRAENLPFSDFPSFSTDPYIHATVRTSLPKRHKQDPDLVLRTPTIHRNCDPKWETQWVIAHVPASGFFLKCRLYDEDAADHDDRLGNVHVRVSNISDDWPGIHEQSYDLKKRMGSKRAYTFRGVAAMLKKGLKMNARLVVSVENLGRTPGDSGGRCYTVVPLPWSRHHSPLIGRIAGTKDREVTHDGKKTVKRYNFQAVQMQLRGPVPVEMYHRYVEFKPFIAGMFTDVTLRGRILNRALHHQHARIYNYDTTTVYGVFEQPCVEMTRQFLEFCHYDQGGRTYTYVLSLDGLLRFTETGKEFGIDMLSKHTMHSDVSIYIAFSGEFFIRRLKHPRTTRLQSQSPTANSEHDQDLAAEIAPPTVDKENDSDNHLVEHSHNDIPKDPSYYVLIIDNDSGTYRPKADLLPRLQEFMSQNFPGLRVATLDCQKDEELMKKLKDEQREQKNDSGKQMTYMQNSSMSSLSSSDEEKLDARVSGVERPHGYKKRISKKHAHEKDSGDVVRGVAGDEQRGGAGTSTDATLQSLSDRDSRDYPSSASEAGEEGEDSKIGGYPNKALPTLLKKDANGQLLRPERSETEDEPLTRGFGKPETGGNRPAGGIVYNKIVSIAAAEKEG